MFLNAKDILASIAATFLLLVFYFSVTTVVSGLEFTQRQFSSYSYYFLALAAGFGIQVGLYFNLKRKIKKNKTETPKKALVATGSSSALAMISCCAHYLVNILPMLGTSGILALISSYQIQFFWVGLASNALGIAFMANKIIKFNKQP